MPRVKSVEPGILLVESGSCLTHKEGEIVETISAEGTATAKRLISDEEQLREFEMMELQEEFAENELRCAGQSASGTASLVLVYSLLTGECLEV
jgi:hypothetical protein